jgi:hypothetical protein
MNRLFVYGLLVFGMYYMVNGGIGIVKDITDGNLAQVIDGLSESELNQKIIEHYKSNILGGVTDLYADAVTTTISDLNNDGKEDVIAIVESSATCTGGGCVASIFMENGVGELTALPFRMAVQHIEVLESMTQGMHDLKVNHDETYRMVWDGSTYVIENN